MEAVILCGIQASGKTAFYVERFLHTHVRISLDVVRTRRRETDLVRACLEAGQRFVVDNTNPTAVDRARYVEPAREAGFGVAAYWLETDPEEAIRRNAGRRGRARVPVAAIRGTAKRFQPPRHEEGFDRVFTVRPKRDGGFRVSSSAG